MRSIKTLTKRMLFSFLFLVLVNGQSERGNWVEKVTVRVDGLACPFCAYGLEKKLERLEGVDNLDIKINDGIVILYSKETDRIDEILVRKKVKESGFTPREIERETLEIGVPKTDIDKTEKIHLNISGMKCEFCVLNIETAMRNIEGVDKVDVNLENNSAELLVKKGSVKSKTLIEIIERLGQFRATLKK